MEFAILGPLRIGGPGGVIRIGAPKQRALLAALLLAYRDDGVSRPTRLIDVLWDEDPPPTATKALQVPRLPAAPRARGRDDRHAPVGLRDPGRHGRSTSRASRRSSASARDAEPARAAELLREALALFRGPPLADAPLYGPGRRRGRPARRSCAWPRSSAASTLDLELGRHGELASASWRRSPHEHPYRERFHAQLMLALYRAGRQADALEAYRRARGTR